MYQLASARVLTTKSSNRLSGSRNTSVPTEAACAATSSSASSSSRRDSSSLRGGVKGGRCRENRPKACGATKPAPPAAARVVSIAFSSSIAARRFCGIEVAHEVVDVGDGARHDDAVLARRDAVPPRDRRRCRRRGPTARCRRSRPTARRRTSPRACRPRRWTPGLRASSRTRLQHDLQHVAGRGVERVRTPRRPARGRTRA